MRFERFFPELGDFLFRRRVIADAFLFNDVDFQDLSGRTEPEIHVVAVGNPESIAFKTYLIRLYSVIEHRFKRILIIRDKLIDGIKNTSQIASVVLVALPDFLPVSSFFRKSLQRRP